MNDTTKPARLKGWRTLLVSLAGAALVWLQSAEVAQFVSDNPGISATVFLALQLVLRWITTTPIFQAKSSLVGPVLAIGLCLGLGGCSTLERAHLDSPRASLVAAQEAYTTLLGSLSEARKAGLISDDKMRTIKPYIASAGAAFDLWDYAIRTDDPAGIAEWSKATTDIIALLQHLYKETTDNVTGSNEFSKGAGLRAAAFGRAGPGIDIACHC